MSGKRRGRAVGSGPHRSTARPVQFEALKLYVMLMPNRPTPLATAEGAGRQAFGHRLQCRPARIRRLFFSIHQRAAIAALNWRIDAGVLTGLLVVAGVDVAGAVDGDVVDHEVEAVLTVGRFVDCAAERDAGMRQVDQAADVPGRRVAGGRDIDVWQRFLRSEVPRASAPRGVLLSACQRSPATPLSGVPQRTLRQR